MQEQTTMMVGKWPIIITEMNYDYDPAYLENQYFDVTWKLDVNNEDFPKEAFQWSAKDIEKLKLDLDSRIQLLISQDIEEEASSEAMNSKLEV